MWAATGAEEESKGAQRAGSGGLAAANDERLRRNGRLIIARTARQRSEAKRGRRAGAQTQGCGRVGRASCAAKEARGQAHEGKRARGYGNAMRACVGGPGFSQTHTPHSAKNKN